MQERQQLALLPAQPVSVSENFVSSDFALEEFVRAVGREASPESADLERARGAMEYPGRSVLRVESRLQVLELEAAWQGRGY